jgi:hypothetical protein
VRGGVMRAAWTPWFCLQLLEKLRIA